MLRGIWVFRGSPSPLSLPPSLLTFLPDELTEKQQFQFPARVPLIPAELPFDLVVDPPGFFRLLAEATRHYGFQGHSLSPFSPLSTHFSAFPSYWFIQISGPSEQKGPVKASSCGPARGGRARGRPSSARSVLERKMRYVRNYWPPLPPSLCFGSLFGPLRQLKNSVQVGLSRISVQS